MSYEELLRIDCKIYKKILIVVFGIIIIFLLLLNMNFYDVYNTKGYITNNNLILNIPYNYSDTIANGKYLKINNIKYNLKIITVNSPSVGINSNLIYQEIMVKLDENLIYNDNTVLNVSIYYNKEKLLDKIKKLL